MTGGAATGQRRLLSGQVRPGFEGEWRLDPAHCSWTLAWGTGPASWRSLPNEQAAASGHTPLALSFTGRAGRARHRNLANSTEHRRVSAEKQPYPHTTRQGERKEAAQRATLVQLWFNSNQNLQKSHSRIYFPPFFLMDNRLGHTKSHLKSSLHSRVPPK